MVTIDKDTKTSFQKPYPPTSKSGSLVITIPKMFTNALDISEKTKLMVRLDEQTSSIIIKKVVI